MSYDVTAGGESFNYTSNMSRFFKDFGVYPGSWEGRNRFEVADEIDLAFTSIEANQISALKSEYDAPNGWGDVEGATKFLREVRGGCRMEAYVIPDSVSVWS